MQLLHDFSGSANDFVTSTKPFAEWLFYISGIILCFVGIRGLSQIRLLKADMLARSERSAKEKALEAAEAFLNDFMNDYIVLWDKMQTEGLKNYEGPIGKFKIAEFKGEQFEQAQKRLMGQRWLKPFNKLEAIAAAFITGIADEEVGFDIIGLDFVEIVKTNYDIYTLCQLKEAEGKQFFLNTIKLYQAWAPRFTEQELERARDFLDERLQALEKPILPKLKPNI